ncbi:MAG: hypothetical protein SFX73_36195 [Kofleriaceae bacterium]|nr:hypothetical protein [Kofleriaceae bacterium]
MGPKKWVQALVVVVLVCAWSVGAGAQDVSSSHAAAPTEERLLLELGGAGLGFLSAIGTGFAAGGLYELATGGRGWGPVAAVVVAIVHSVMAVPGAVWGLARTSGRDGNVGATLLGGLLGVAVGGAIILGGYAADQFEDSGLDAALYVAGSVTAGLGLVIGSMIGYELSLDDDGGARMTLGPGSLGVQF